MNLLDLPQMKKQIPPSSKGLPHQLTYNVSPDKSPQEDEEASDDSEES
jgi:hypothetical protein